MNVKHKLKDGNEIVIKQLTIKDVDVISSLQQKVLETLTTPSFLSPLSEEEFLYILNGKGTMIGAFLKDRLIAFRAMLEPKIDENHLGKDAGLDWGEWPFVLYQEISNVDPDFRGNSLQQYLGNLLMKEVDTKRYHYVCATVAPFNIASLKDKFSYGLEIVSLNEKYGGLLRYTLMKDLKKTDNKTEPFESRNVLMENTEQQQFLLGEGWIGTGIEEVDGHWTVRYENRN